jgi:hypothetical protein
MVSKNVSADQTLLSHVIAQGIMKVDISFVEDNKEGDAGLFMRLGGRISFVRMANRVCRRHPQCDREFLQEERA